VAGNMRLTGALFDTNNASGTLGMVLQSTGTGQQWVATSTLGITGGAGSPCTTTGYSLQYNNNGTFGCVSKFITDGTLVGYNATSSSISFNIQGTSGSSNTIFNVASSSGTSYLNVLANGNVGIGSTTPTQKLVVQGNADISGHIALGNEALIDQAFGLNINT